MLIKGRPTIYIKFNNKTFENYIGLAALPSLFHMSDFRKNPWCK